MGTLARCRRCGDTIESKGHRHNFVTCSCGACFVDGGDEYSRVGGDIEVLDSWTRLHGKLGGTVDAEDSSHRG